MLRSVILEGTILGVVASAVGLGLGVLLAKGLTKLFAALDLEMPQSSMVFQTRTAVVAMLTGTLVTLVASVWPAVRATRIAPISAVREGGMAVKRQSRKTPVFGFVVTGLSVFGLVYGTLGEGVSTGVRILGIAGGAFGIFIGSRRSHHGSFARSHTSSASLPPGWAARLAGWPRRTRSGTPAAPRRPRRR